MKLLLFTILIITFQSIVLGIAVQNEETESKSSVEKIKDFIKKTEDKVENLWDKVKGAKTATHAPNSAQEMMPKIIEIDSDQYDNNEYGDWMEPDETFQFIIAGLPKQNSLEDVQSSMQRDPFEPLIRVQRSDKEAPNAESADETSAKLNLKRSGISGFRLLNRNMPGDTAEAYRSKSQHPAPEAVMYNNYFSITLPVFIVWGLLVMFCVFGLRPQGAICRNVFTTRSDPLTRMV